MSPTTRRFRCTAATVLLSFICFQLTPFGPTLAAAGTSSNKQDLKQIEYKYYFRGNYGEAITKLRDFLERKNLTKEETVEAREFLAASLVMTGESAEAKTEYLKLLKMDGAYTGPDPSVFKAVVIESFQEVQSEYASAVIRNAPATGATSASAADAATDPDSPGKPVYKKWWFYATMGAALLLIAGAASGGSDDEPPPADTGRVTVGVDIQ